VRPSSSEKSQRCACWSGAFASAGNLARAARKTGADRCLLRPKRRARGTRCRARRSRACGARRTTRELGATGAVELALGALPRGCRRARPHLASAGTGRRPPLRAVVRSLGRTPLRRARARRRLSALDAQLRDGSSPRRRMPGRAHDTHGGLGRRTAARRRFRTHPRRHARWSHSQLASASPRRPFLGNARRTRRPFDARAVASRTLTCASALSRRLVTNGLARENKRWVLPERRMRGPRSLMVRWGEPDGHTPSRFPCSSRSRSTEV